MPFPAIKVAEGNGEIKHAERVNLNIVDSITEESFKDIIKDQWGEELPWILAATLDLDDKGGLWRSYFDAHRINEWLLDDQFQRIAGRANPMTRRPIITIDYFSINRVDKKFEHIGTLAQLVKNNHSKVRLFLQAAKGDNNKVAMNNLGVLLEKEGELEKAKRWYKKAAGLDCPIAMNNLGVLLQKEGKATEAKGWFKKAAGLGNAVAMNNLGALLDKEGKVTEAKGWFKKAAGLGDAVAMNNLGALLQNEGRLAEAKGLYKKATNLGNADAMNSLGVLLANEGELVEAKEWWQKAAGLGNAIAKSNLRILQRREQDESQEDDVPVLAKKRARTD